MKGKAKLQSRYQFASQSMPIDFPLCYPASLLTYYVSEKKEKEKEILGNAKFIKGTESIGNIIR